MSESSIETQENKQLLWGILMEEGIFDMIPRNVSPNDIQRLFEGALKNLSNTAPPNLPLMELNRLAIESLVTIIPQAEKYVTISVQDARNKKRHEIDAKLREKEAESRAFLERAPPPQIDFTDKNISYARGRNPNSSSSSHPENVIIEVDVTNDAVSSFAPLTLTRPKEYNDDINDSPIGEDMDRLIADRIAARERDLAEIAEHIKPPDGYKMDTMIMRQPVQPPLQEPLRVLQTIHSSASTADMEVKSKVRFTDTDTNIVVISNNDDNTMHTQSNPVTSSVLSNQFEVDNIYSRLKRKMSAVPSTQPQPPNNGPNYEEIINDLRRQILEIKENQKDMFDRLDRLTSYITRE
jgi:hypothetical protein